MTDDPSGDRAKDAPQSGIPLVSSLGSRGPRPGSFNISKNRYGRVRESALFRRLSEDAAVRCERKGLVSREGFVIARLIEADASRGRNVDGKAHALAGSGEDHAPSAGIPR